METKTQRNERLRQMRKKYHLGEFKHHSSVTKSTRRFKKMARRRRTSRRSSSSSSSLSGLGTQALGIAGYIAFEKYAEPLVASYVGNGMILNLAELAAGVYLSKKGGFVGSFGKAAVVINMYQILAPLINGIAPSS